MGLVLRIWGLGLGLEFRIWGLGFGIWGLGWAHLWGGDPSPLPVAVYRVGVVVAHEVVVSTDTAGPNVTAELNGVTAALVAKLRQTESSQGDCQHNTCGSRPHSAP